MKLFSNLLAMSMLPTFNLFSLEPLPALKLVSERRGAPRTYARNRSKYAPHQGRKEMARRVRQMAKAGAV